MVLLKSKKERGSMDTPLIRMWICLAIMENSMVITRNLKMKVPNELGNPNLDKTTGKKKCRRDNCPHLSMQH